MTGAAKRIGREIALALGGRGADVCLTYNGSEKDAISTLQDLRQLGVKAEAFQCNLAVAETIRPTVDKAIQFLGGLDLLVNNAGVFCLGCDGGYLSG